jgi:regulation of enolase protein 1 (concanavalin A-like superfamily)
MFREQLINFFKMAFPSGKAFFTRQQNYYILTRNAPLQDNAPVMVGLMAASPDGKGFEAKFEHFSVKHLPDQRRLEWLKTHQ